LSPCGMIVRLAGVWYRSGMVAGAPAMPRDPPGHLDDEALLEEGERALTERLGTAGTLRFLSLVAGGHDRFEDIRKEWQHMTMEETLEAMGVRPRRQPAPATSRRRARSA